MSAITAVPPAPAHDPEWYIWEPMTIDNFQSISFLHVSIPTDFCHVVAILLQIQVIAFVFCPELLAVMCRRVSAIGAYQP